MKKSKVIIPAMALLLFSTAASITGTVAWFTSTRVYTMSAGDFAVVNTKDNLNATLAPGIGTILDSNNAKAIKVGENAPIQTFTSDGERTTAAASLAEGDKGKVYKQGDSYYVCTGAKTLSGPFDRPYALTDSSFDHNIAAQNLVVPDNEGTKIGSLVGMSSNPSPTVSTPGIIRDANSATGAVLSAMTWDITFTVTFSPSATKDTGIFLDARADKSNVKLANGDPVTDTGYAFKIAIMPKTVPANSLGLTKVWADNRPAYDSEHPETVHSQYIGGGSANDELSTRTAEYGSTTAQYVDGTRTPDFASPALIDTNCAVGIPEESSKTKDDAKAMSNYLGYFKCNAGHNVSLTFTCIAFFEGSDPTIETAESTIYETVKAQMTFGVSNLKD